MLSVRSSLFTALTATQGVRVASSWPTPGARDTCLNSGLEFHQVANVPRDSCTFPRCNGRITHKQEDAPDGGFGPDLPCYPPMSHKSSRFEVHDPGNRGFPRSLILSLLATSYAAIFIVHLMNNQQVFPCRCIRCPLFTRTNCCQSRSRTSRVFGTQRSPCFSSCSSCRVMHDAEGFLVSCCQQYYEDGPCQPACLTLRTRHRDKSCLNPRFDTRTSAMGL